MSIVRYISHPDVDKNPDVLVPQWGLSDEGVRRGRAMVADQPWVADIGRIIASDETKAQMMAAIVAEHLGLEVETRTETGETDRSATGFVSEERHEDLADRFFRFPDRSADGWETATAAQQRVVAALSDVLAPPSDVSVGPSDIAVIGHGGVGTLLRSHLAGLPIDRVHDQPGQGHYWSYDRNSGAMLHGWLAIDEPVGQ